MKSNFMIGGGGGWRSPLSPLSLHSVLFDITLSCCLPCSPLLSKRKKPQMRMRMRMIALFTEHDACNLIYGRGKQPAEWIGEMAQGENLLAFFS